MRCPSCQAETVPGMKFCGNCGTKLPALCPGCGTEVLPGFKFCGECGTPLAPAAPAPAAAGPAAVAPAPPPVAAAPPPPPAPPVAAAPPRPNEGERKQVTVLHCELTIAAAGASEIHHEKVHALLNRFFELAQSQVQQFEGTVKQFLGNGFMALFGAPIAHEDHARRAVLAAVGVRQAVESWSRQLAEEQIHLELQLGLDTGTVVVGGVGDMIVGATTNIASRLKQKAGPNEILIGDATARMVRGAVPVEPADSLALPGQSQPLPVFRVGGRSETQDASGARLTPFVGRARELGVLSEVLQLATQGQGQAVGIAGEPGSGKSRLLLELRRRMKGRQVIYLQGGCLSYGSGIPYQPLRNMIRRASQIGEHDDAATVAAKLRRSLEGVGSDPEALPYFLRLLDVEAGAESLDGLEPQAIKAQTFAAMRQMMHHASQKALVVMELEDLHWVDATSEDFLASLVESLGAARILLLCTYRSGYQPKWMDKSYATQLSLRRLSDHDSRALAAAVFENAGLPEELQAEVLAKAEGNPFFLEELARALAERASGGEGGAVPSTIQGVLMARIDRLPEDHKRLLQTASVLGREFPRELLRALWENDGLDGLLADLKAWEFLFEQPSARDPRYLFKHALTQDVAYDSLLVGRRQTLHRQAAEAIEKQFAGRLDDAYDRLVYHYPRGGEAAKTVHYLGLFASRAARNFAHAEAARALRESLEHAEKLPDRDRKVAGLVIDLAESLLPLAQFPQTLEILKTHAGRVEAAGDPRLAAKFHFWLAHTYSYMGDQQAAAANAEKSIALARETGDEATEGLAHYVLGRDGFWSGQFAKGVESSQRAVVLLERAGEPWWQGQSYWVAGFNQYVLGQFEKAFESLLRAQTIGSALADPRLDPSWSIGHFYATLGEWETGLDYCNQAVANAKDPLNGAVASGFLGHALLEKGDLGEATQILEPAMSKMKEAGMQQIFAWFAAYLAEAYAESGRLDRAQGIGEEGLVAAQATEFRYGVALSQRAIGVVALKKGDRAAAESWLNMARQTFEALETPFEVGRTWLRLAQASLAAQDRDAARTALKTAGAAFEKLYVPKYLEQTQRLAADHQL
jgi:class 3 adenylate cyclase/tetratricopeptide (TPR) repeat protein